MKTKLELLKELTDSANWGLNYHIGKINNEKSQKKPDENVLAYHKKELKKERLRLDAFDDLTLDLKLN